MESGPGAIITVNPGEVHDGRPIGGARVWRMLYLAPALVAAARDDLARDAPPGAEFTAPVFDRADWRGLFLSLYRAGTEAAGDAGRMAFDAALGEVVVALCGGKDRGRGPAPAVLTARDYLHDQRDGPVTLAELAAVTGLSRFHLNRAFRAAFGIPPHAYLLQLRVARARQLIASGVTLSSAAAEAGFADQSHMTRIFTRQFGYPPSALAQANRKIVQDRRRRAS